MQTDNVDNKSILILSLKDFVDSADVSVRLHNCITNAFSEGICPFRTIEEYLKAGNSSIPRMLRIQNCGRKTAYELDELIKDAVGNLDFNEGTNDLEHMADSLDGSEFIWHGERFATKCLEQDLCELIQSRPTSARLRNCFEKFFKEESFPCKTVRDILIGGDRVISALLRYENFGRNSANELKELVDAFLLDKRDNCKEISSPKGVSELICDLLEQLKPQERKVLRCRYGIDEETVQTLEEIGNQLGVTRERIRQIEKKAIGKLSHKLNRRQILDVLSHNQMSIFGSLADANGVVWKRGMARLPGEYRLAIEITHGSFSAWINSMAVELRAGWLRSDLFTPAFESCQQKLTETLAGIRLPTPFALVAK
jgi:RNA polymerase sigma factor (sigma-70 family)